MRKASPVTGNGSTRSRAIAALINGLVASLLIWPVASLAAMGEIGRRTLASFWYIQIDALIFGPAFVLVAVAHAAGWRGRWPLQIGVVIAALVLPVIVFAAWTRTARP